MPAHHWAPFFKSTLPFLHANPPLGPLVLVYVADFSGQPITEPPFFSLRCRFSCQPTTWPLSFGLGCRFFRATGARFFSLRCANPPMSPLFLSLRCRFFTPTHRWFSLFLSTLPFFQANPPLSPLFLVYVADFSTPTHRRFALFSRLK